MVSEVFLFFHRRLKGKLNGTSLHAKSPVTLLLTATFRVLPEETVKKSICTISGEQHPEDRSTLWWHSSCLFDAFVYILLHRMTTADAEPAWLIRRSSVTHYAAVARSIPDSSPTNVCTHVCKYVDKNDSVVMLTAKRSTGVAPGMNLRNPLQAGDKEYKQGIKTQGRRHEKSKTGISAHMRDWCRPM